MMNNWKCKICGFEANKEVEKEEHVKKSTDKAHQELLKERAKNKFDEAQENVEEMWEEVKGKARQIVE